MRLELDKLSNVILSSTFKGDILMREWLEKNLKGQFVGLDRIERTSKTIKVIINTSRPGIVIGKSGEGVIKIKFALEKILVKQAGEIKPNLQIEVVEIKNAEGNASIVGQMIAEESRSDFLTDVFLSRLLRR